MILTPDGYMHIYMLNVGQGDTTVIITPIGNIIIIDSTHPAKLIDLLTKLGCNGNIEHLIITHPHTDHYGGANSLTQSFTISKATLAPFWHTFGMGPPTYQKLVGRLEAMATDINYLSGYTRWYPDAVMVPGDSPQVDPGKPYLELLGPTNDLVRLLEDSSSFETNHLSIMCRLSWNRFRMVISGDAQMENWAYFDHERLLEKKCQVLRAAHHGARVLI